MLKLSCSSVLNVLKNSKIKQICECHSEEGEKRDVDGSVGRVQRLLSNDTRLKWKRMKKAKRLKKEYRGARVLFPRQMLKKTASWCRSVVFSDQESLTLMAQMCCRTTGPKRYSTRGEFSWRH